MSDDSGTKDPHSFSFVPCHNGDNSPSITTGTLQGAMSLALTLPMHTPCFFLTPMAAPIYPLYLYPLAHLPLQHSQHHAIATPAYQCPISTHPIAVPTRVVYRSHPGVTCAPPARAWVHVAAPAQTQLPADSEIIKDKKKDKDNNRQHQFSYHRTEARFQRDETIEGARSGANEPKEIKPVASPADLFWVIDKAGDSCLRSFYEIENRISKQGKGGRWMVGPAGNVFYQQGENGVADGASGYEDHVYQA